jgi:hypothetical protein
MALFRRFLLYPGRKEADGTAGPLINCAAGAVLKELYLHTVLIVQLFPAGTSTDGTAVSCRNLH